MDITFQYWFMLPIAVLIATSVMVVAMRPWFASTGHVTCFARQGGEVLDPVLSLVVFTIPGVIVGRQLGSTVASVVIRQSQTQAIADSLAVAFGTPSPFLYQPVSIIRL